MADISKELDNFKNAKYGKDVRGSMVSLAEKLNKESSDTVKTVSEYGDAEASREQAEQDRQNAENARRQDFKTMQSDSQTATTAANEAAERAEQAATGDMSLKTVTFEVAAARAGIVSGDTLGVAFGKLAKYCTDIEDHAFNALVNNGLANIAGVSALDAVQANPDVADTLAYKIAQNLAAITSLNSKITETISENLKATQIGNVVIINGYCSGTFTDQKTTIGKLSKVGLPNIFVRTLCNIGSDAYSAQRQGYLYVNDNNGEVAVTSKSGEAGSNVYVSCSYVVK